MEKVFTIDVNLDNLQNSIQKIRNILEKYKELSGYYLMVYSEEDFIGVKFILDESKKEVFNKIKGDLSKIKEFKKFSQLDDNGLDASKDSYLASIAMNACNKIIDLYENKDLTEEDFNTIMFYIFHYISNPLKFDYEHEFKFCLNHLWSLYMEALKNKK